MGIGAGTGYLISKVKGRTQSAFPSQPIDRVQAAELVRTHIALQYTEAGENLTEMASSFAFDMGVHEFTQEPVWSRVRRNRGRDLRCLHMREGLLQSGVVALGDALLRV